jgi:hypothetical protein
MFQVKETAAKVFEVASRTRAGRAAQQLKQEWEEAAVGLPKVLPAFDEVAPSASAVTCACAAKSDAGL